jgi:hypothetical protein
MTDIVDCQTRSRMMSGIRGKNTKPELPLRHGSGNAPRVLGGQVRCKCGAGCDSSVHSSGRGLADRNSLGMRPADWAHCYANTGHGGGMASWQ